MIPAQTQIWVKLLKLAVYYLQLQLRISHKLPRLNMIDQLVLDIVKDQKTLKDKYVKDQGKQELEPMNIYVHTAPSCFKRLNLTLATMRGSNGTPLIYMIRTKLTPKDPDKDPG